MTNTGAMFSTRVMAIMMCVLLSTVACGGSDTTTDTTSDAGTVATTTPADATTVTPAQEPSTSPEQGTATPTVDVDQAPAAPTADAGPPQGFVGEWPNRFCVDAAVVETTLNLRAAPSTDAEVLASIPRSSCDLLLGGLPLDNGFQEVIYTTVDGAIDGWVSADFIEFQDPPTRVEAAVLLFVDAWLRGVDTGQYSYEVGQLPTPITAGHPVLVEGSEGFGCVLVGDITIDCAVALVERDGTEIARLSLGATQRGTDGNDGTPYFPDDFPDGPTVTSFAIVDG